MEGGYASIGDYLENGNGTKILVNNGTIISNVAGQALSVVPNGGIANFVNGTLTGGHLGGHQRRDLAGVAAAGDRHQCRDDPARRQRFELRPRLGSTNALSSLTANAAGASLTIADGYNLTAGGAFANAGAITVGANSIFALAGQFTQTGGSVDLEGGTLGNMAPPAGEALHFDGSDNFVTAPDSPALHSSDAITVSGWFKVDGFPRTWQTIFFKGNSPDTISGNTDREFALFLNSAGYLQLSSTPLDRVTSSALAAQTANGLVQASQWYHFDAEISASGNFMRLYLNGVLVAQSAYDTSGIRDTTGPFQLGAAPGWDNTFQGSIADVSLWNVIRTPDQINADMFRNLAGTETGLIGYWPLNEGSGTVAHDLTANADNGTVAGSAPTWVSVPLSSVSLQSGTLSGHGTIAASLTNAAKIDVGGAGTAGTLIVTGNYTQTATGVLDIDVGGTVAGSQFDQLEVYGTANLGGVLNVDLTNGLSADLGADLRHRDI